MTKKTQVTFTEQPSMMSSREIAKLTGKKISQVHTDIRAMIPALYAIDNGEDVRSYAWGTTKDEMIAFLNHHKIQGIKFNLDDRGYVYEFLLDRRHTEILITGYDVERRAAVIDRWFSLETQYRQPVDAMKLLNDPSTLRGLLMNYSEDNERLTGENQILSATVNSLQKHFTKGMSIPQFCKGLNGVNINKMSWWAFQRKWLYNEQHDPEKNPRWRVASYARGKYLTEDETRITPLGEDPFSRFTPVLLEQGCHRLYQLYMKGELPMKKTWNGEYSHDKAIYSPEEK
ncbi:Rha family transcriptional regulator [Salmonella enterica]|nr:Rha family transcriptional regulator [Salmonella enterica]